MIEIVEKCQRQKRTQIIVQELIYNRLAELRVHVFALPEPEICKASGDVKTHHFEIVYLPLYKSGDLEMADSKCESPETALWTIYRGQREFYPMPALTCTWVRSLREDRREFGCSPVR